MPDIWMDVDVALAEVPVNIMSLLDDTDFKTRETAVAYNAAGMDLVWNFVTCAGAMSQTAVTPTTGGNYDWAHQGDGMYSIEIPASGGASINNDTEGVGWFTGIATGVLAWRGPTIGFRRAALNDLFIDGGTASTNLEDFFDGTGYAGGTAKLETNAVAISGDTTAADNLEAACDGNTYNVGGGAVVAASVTGAVGSVTGAVGSVTGAVGSVTGNVGGNVAGSVASVTGNVGGNVVGSVASVTAGVTIADATSDAVIADAVWNAETATYGGAGSYGALIESGNVGGGAIVAASVTGAVGSVTGAVGSVTGNVGGNVAGSVASVTGNVGGNVVGSVASVTGAVGSVTGNVGGSVASVTGNVGGNVTGSVGSVVAEVQADVAKISGDSVAADNAESFFDGTGYAGTNNTIPTVTTLTNAPSDSSGVTTLLTRVVGTIAAGTHNAQSGDAFARLGAPAGASVSADVASIKTDTGTTIPNRLPAALVGGRMDSSVGAMANGTVTAAAIATDAIDADAIAASAVAEIQAGLSTLDAAGVRTAIGLAAANLDTQLAALPTDAENADAVWDEAIAGHLGAGSTGTALNAAGSAGDPWATAIPGAYGAGTAGKILGDNINATISSRSSHSAADVWAVVSRTLTAFSDSSGVTTLLGRITSILGIYTAADMRGAVGLATANLDTQIAAIDDYVDTEVAAIKAVTDKVDTAIELDGAVYRFTANALEQAPTGGSAPTVTQIRQEIDANSTQLAAIKVATDKVNTTLVQDGAVYDFTSAALAAAPSGGLDAAGVRTAVGLASANLDTQLSALTTIANRIGAFAGSGVNTVLGFLKAITNKAATLPTDIGGTYDPATDSLEALKDNGISAVSVTLTQIATQLPTTTTSGTAWTLYPGQTWSVSLTGIGNISTRTKLWFTLKEDRDDTDASALLFVEETGGLTVVNKAAYATTTNGSIVVSDATTGALTLTIKPAVTIQLTDAVLVRGFKWLSSAGVVTAFEEGNVTLTRTVVSAVS
jgi:hypothetical protein